MNPANQHPAFGAEDQETLAALVPTGEAVEEIIDLPAKTEAQAPAADPAPAPAAATANVTPEPEAAAPAANQGDLRAALRAARAAERRMRDQLAAKDAEIEAFKQGKPPVDTNISDADLAQMQQDFPLQAQLVEKQRRLEEELAQLRTKVAPPEFQPPHYDPEIQVHIDAVPQLLAWQHSPEMQDRFKAAIAHDQQLEVDPAWQNRSIADRFAEAARRAGAQFTPTPVAPPTPRTDPAQVIAAAPLAQPRGISDFRGGGPASAPASDYRNMSDEAILASLPAEG